MSEILETGTNIVLYDGAQRLDFTIGELLGAGNSAACYKAVRNEKSGTLRKFIGTDSARFVEPYDQLKEIQRDYDEIKSFIPQVEIYHDAEGIPYIWSVEPKLKTFEEICTVFRSGDNATVNIILALSALRDLTQCVLELHRAGLIHRDIKPSNFGFLKRGGKILTQTVSLFDIDTICSVYSPPPDFVGTHGFSDFSEPVSNLTDIYSIGATFFFALTGGTFSNEDFDELENIVDECSIFANMFNPPPRLKPLIVKILQHCLCASDKRYQSCEELLQDFEKALNYSKPAGITNLDELQKYLNSHDAYTALQYHLYETPLYAWYQPSAKNLNVLVIGCGKYAQIFLDTCLTVGQFPNANLQVTVLGNDAGDFEIYTKSRPALKDFFAIGDNVQPDSYGQIEFKELSLFDGAANEKLLQDLICDYSYDQRPNYIFIALGDNALNLRAAQACEEALEILEISCGISFVCEGGDRVSCDENIIPVYVDENIKNWDCHAEIERMAFNVHLVWEKNLLVDFAKLKSDFRNPYNHKSCLLNVISMKYKLHSLGIELDADAAENFLRLELSRHQQKFDELIYFEHRRWVTEKICDGWTKRHIHECHDGKTQNRKQKTHVCIVKSAPNQNLSRNFTLKEWDKPSKNQLEKLDELDKMSLELHRFFADKKSKIQGINILHGEQMITLQNLVGSDRELTTCLNEWSACLEDIWNGRRQRLRIYESLLDKLRDKSKRLSVNYREEASALIDYLDQQFKIIRESLRYENYKDIDAKLMLEIPFILTYTENICLVVPYNEGDGTKTFSNLAANFVVNARKIIYLLYVSKAGELNALKNYLEKDLPRIFKYANEKNLRAKFEFAVAYPASCQIEALSATLEKFDKVQRVKLLPFNKAAEVPQVFADHLKNRNRPRRLLAIEKNSTRLSGIFEVTGVYDGFDAYEFDLNTQIFTTSGKCGALNYIHKPSHLTLTDLFPNIISHDKPEFFSDYESLWRLYRRNVSTWKALCNWLAKDSGAETIATFERNYNPAAEPEKFRYIIPIECMAAVSEKILKPLRAASIIENDSKIIVQTPSSCVVTIRTKCPNTRSKWDNIFANPYRLMKPAAVAVKPKPSEIAVTFDSLIARNLKNPPSSDVMNLLKELANRNYLTRLENSSGSISFTYSTHQIKRLLTVAGRILEIYVYHKTAASGLFNDVTCSCEISWAGGEFEPKSEFDCALTKGFQSIFIECKARNEIEQDVYYRLRALSDKFGVNVKAVLVTDTMYDSNEIQRQRGELLDIPTIWQPEELDALDETLLKILQSND